MAITLAVASPVVLSEAGGILIQITGIFIVGNRHQMHIGDTGSVADQACRSGIPESGIILYSENGTLLEGYTPRMPKGVMDLFITDLDAVDDGTMAGSITVLAQDYTTLVHRLRSTLPPYYRTGSRSMAQLLEV